MIVDKTDLAGPAAGNYNNLLEASDLTKASANQLIMQNTFIT